MSTEKRIKIMFILCFFIIIILPIRNINWVNGKVYPAENRYLAEFPQIINHQTGKIEKEFFSGFENWINDNIGFRDNFVRLDKFLDFRVFKDTPDENIIIGNEGWLFHKSDYEENNTKIKDEEVEEYKLKYSKMTSYFNSKNQDFFIIVFPRKSMMYKEDLPDTINKDSRKTLTQEMKETLENQEGFDLQVKIEELNKSKQELDIYSKAYDLTHWNNYGGFIGYTELMNRVKTYIPNIKVLTKDEFEINTIERETYLAGVKYTTETDFEFKPKYEVHGKNDKEFFDRIGYTSKDPWKSYNYYFNEDKSLPKAIIVGDSYIWMFMLDKLSESFSELVFIHQLDIDKLDYINAIIQPDIIIAAGLDRTILGVAEYEVPIINPNAEIVYQNTPNEIERGKKYDLDITVKNISNDIWSEKKNVRLCIWQDGNDFGYRIKFPDGFELKPGEKYTFTLNDFQAPQGNQTYLEYQMLQEGIAYFGEKERVDIEVR